MAVGKGRQSNERMTAVYQRHAPAVAAYVLRRTSTADAPDVVSETFLVAWRRRDVVPAEPETLPWLYGVARNVLANHRRGDRRRTKLAAKLAVLFEDAEIDPPSVEHIEELSGVGRALRALSDDDAEILLLASWEALSSTEIGHVLDLPPGTARQRLHRARRRLRAQLGVDDTTSAAMISSQDGSQS